MHIAILMMHDPKIILAIFGRIIVQIFERNIYTLFCVGISLTICGVSIDFDILSMYIVTKDGIVISYSKVNTLLDVPILKNVKQLYSSQ